jgi:glycosyltransferase involved in cell wall biosynthesis
MRIAVTWKAGTPWLGGWNYYLNMVRVCRQFAPDIEFFLACDGELEAGKYAEMVAAGALQILPLPSRKHGYVRGLLGIRDIPTETILAAAHIDAVFELTPLRARYGVPALVWLADFQHRKLPGFFSRKERLKRDLSFWARLSFRRHAMVSSQSAFRDLLEFLPRPRAKVDVVPFAVLCPDGITAESIDNVLRRYAIQRPYFFLPNQFWQHKNHATAFQAVALAVRKNPAIMLVLSGQNLDSRAHDYPAGLMQVLASGGAENNVRLLGTIHHNDLINLIAGARALINPSLFEGWSTTVEEAKALGTPMILSALEVHQEQAASQAEFFSPKDPVGLSAAMLSMLATTATDDAARRGAAAQWSRDARKAYAGKLRAVLAATIADGI